MYTIYLLLVTIYLNLIVNKTWDSVLYMYVIIIDIMPKKHEGNTLCVWELTFLYKHEKDPSEYIIYFLCHLNIVSIHGLILLAHILICFILLIAINEVWLCVLVFIL